MSGRYEIYQTILKHGTDILRSKGMQEQKQYIQHGNVSVYEHSVRVACMCVWLAKVMRIRVQEQALVRGALLHDYFLYDWHVHDPSHRGHGFTHARTAMHNAIRDFQIGTIEQNMIERHMFPLNLTPPKYRESVLICIADKICATCETVYVPFLAKTAAKLQ